MRHSAFQACLGNPKYQTWNHCCCPVQIASAVVGKLSKKGVDAIQCINQLAVDTIITGDNQLRSKFLLVSEHGLLTLSNAGENLRQRRLVHLSVARRQRDSKGTESQYFFQRNTAIDLM